MASDFAAMAADSLERIVRIHGATAFGPPAGRWQEALATDIQDLQLQLLLVSESRGGASGGWPDAYTVLRLAGRYAIPLPIAEGMLAARILGSAGMAPDPGIFTIATQVNGEWTRAPSGILFTGQLSSVPWGGAADHVLCVASVAGETVVCVLARASAQVSPAHNLAGERRDVLSFKQAPATVARASGTEANSLLDYSALARLAQIAGSLSAALQLSVDYVCQRKQFGQAIAKFQAIQQQLAVFGTEVAAVTCVVQAACAAADTGTAGFQIAAAKLRANRAIGISTSIAHQVHGAVGLSQEYALQRHTRRLWSWRSEFGNDRYWSEKLGTMAARAGAERFWTELTAADDRVQQRAD